MEKQMPNNKTDKTKYAIWKPKSLAEQKKQYSLFYFFVYIFPNTVCPRSLSPI